MAILFNSIGSLGDRFVDWLHVPRGGGHPHGGCEPVPRSGGAVQGTISAIIKIKPETPGISFKDVIQCLFVL